VDGKLFLNINKTVVGFWEADIPGNLKAANRNWASIEPEPASQAKIPNFSSKAPVTN